MTENELEYLAERFLYYEYPILIGMIPEVDDVFLGIADCADSVCLVSGD